jgi:hypothetical protein
MVHPPIVVDINTKPIAKAEDWHLIKFSFGSGFYREFF